MSTINRIEVANFLNLNGEGESERWNPRYRFVKFNFHGQSAAVNMTNGAGKTSNVEAWLALLTRDRHLISRTREKMAPERDGYYSHIRIEFLVPERGAGAQNDFFVERGSPASGKETRVFGMYGYRSENPHFYFYPGSLEQVPVADTSTGKVALLPNRVFRDKLKATEGNRHNPLREDWIAELSFHVSSVSMRRQAEYQKRGGGDKSAELFAFKNRKSEKYDVTFFYEIIAPELLSGLMGREGEEGEHELEDTILNAVMDVIRACHNTQRKKIELEKMEEILDILSDSAKKAADAEKSQGQYEQERARMIQDVALLRNLVHEQPLPGIPESSTGQDLTGRLRASIIINPGERHYRVTDVGIAGLTGESVGSLNKRARRADMVGDRISQPIVFSCDISSGEHSGPKPRSYTPEDARALVESGGKWAGALTREMALEMLAELDAWFLDQESHRNPYRTQRNELGYDIEQLTRELDANEEDRNRISRELEELGQQQTRLQEHELAYRYVQESGEFTEDEWSNPRSTAESVVLEHQKADEARQKFLVRKNQIGVLKPNWDEFIRRFPGTTNPEEVHQEHEEAEDMADRLLKEINTEKEQAEGKSRTLDEEISSGKEGIISYENLVKQFMRLDAGLEIYAREFGDESPARLDIQVIEEKTQAEEGIKTTSQKIEGVKLMVDYLKSFYSETEARSPADWLSECEEERAVLKARKSNMEREKTELMRQRKDLEQDQVAANAAARQALEYLEAANVPITPLHRAIGLMGLRDDRCREVLSCFSAVLFAPVAKTSDEAFAAAECLAENDLQVPVFMADSLDFFAKEGDLKADKDHGFYYGLVAGVTTRAVECLLDPSLVEREKERLDGLVDDLAKEMGEIERRLKDTAESAHLVVLARKAQRAVEAGAESELTRLNEDLRNLQDRLPTLKQRASEGALDAIRAHRNLTGSVGRENETMRSEAWKNRNGC